ncbi:MAG: hypothetical protein JWQ40_796 [Segetibacter sp.]|nr:hypothetical protein [Segetibacter sp.]
MLYKKTKHETEFIRKADVIEKALRKLIDQALRNEIDVTEAC